jgi:thymidylate synthase
MTTLRNPTHLIIDGLSQLLESGQIVPSRFGTTREILNYHCTIERPLERIIQLPHFDTKIAAQIINGWWILSGSNDIGIIEKYLPQASRRSDDDVTWRGGFGPRLRNWHGVDQIKSVISIITSRPESRRACMSLFDPIYDFQESKDVSTTNSFFFIVRDNRLHMTVSMRSADILGSSVPGGLATNNLYEWSLLLEAMAFWTGYQVGRLHIHIHSLHLYQKDVLSAQTILDGWSGETMYQAKPYQKASFGTPFADFDTTIAEFFTIESRLRAIEISDIPSSNDPLIDTCLQFLWHQVNDNFDYVGRSLSLTDLGSIIRC